MTGSEWGIYAFVMASAICAAVVVYPLLANLLNRSTSQLGRYQHEKVVQATKDLDELFVEVKPRWLKMAYGIGPVAAAGLVYLLSDNVLLAVVGAIIGVILPDVYLRQARAARRRKFQSQLIDALFILSSSLRAGLSLPQAFEQLESEMSPPASQEFGLMMKAHRLGRSLEESLQGLNERMPCDELNLITTAVLVARETGGDITVIITQMISTIRERKKINDKVQTLTLQGRLQAYIMSVLPIGFAIFIRSFNPKYFDQMLADPTGKSLLMLAGVLWVMGMALLFHMSRVEV